MALKFGVVAGVGVVNGIRGGVEVGIGVGSEVKVGEIERVEEWKSELKQKSTRSRKSNYHLVGDNCWFSHDVTKSQTSKLSILLRFYFHVVLEQLKTNFQTNFCFKRVLGFVIKYA